MLARRPILRFFVLLTASYALLMLPWPGLRQAYAAAFRAAGNHLFGTFGSAGQVSFQPAPTPERKRDTTLVLMARDGTGFRRAELPYSSRGGYVATAFFLALNLATPVPWKRRWKSTLCGLLFVNAFVMLVVALGLAVVFYVGNPASPLSRPSKEVLVYLASLAGHTWNSFLVPLFIWLVLAGRHLPVLAQRSAQPAPDPRRACAPPRARCTRSAR